MIQNAMPRRDRRRWPLLFPIAILCGGCSLLFRSESSQCSLDGDCTARGAAFANHVCRAGTCVELPLGNGDDGGATGGATGTTGERDAASEVATTSSGGGGGSDGGAEAEASIPGCTANSDCTPASVTHPEVACDVGSGSCIQLTTDDCPFVIGDYSGKMAAPLFLGAFATLPPSAPQSHPSYLNYSLALGEFGVQGGIPGWDPVRQTTGLRMPVAVVCNADGDIHQAMQHLTNDVHTPGVVAALDSVTLRTTFVNDAYPNVFMINPFGANSTLTSLTTGGLLWHMLGQPSDNAPAYAAFFGRLESYVRTLQGLSPTDTLRIATVTGNATDPQDLAGAALVDARWNDQSFDENNSAGNYRNVAIDSVLSGVDLSAIDVSNAVTTLLDFKPNIIISFGATEFAKLLQVYELDLQSGSYPSNPTPFYLIGPYNMDSQTLLQWIGSGLGAATEAKRKRIAGIGIASASDQHVLHAYENRFLGQFQSGQSALGQENYYDAMYFAVYSAVGAGRIAHLTGDNLKEGMLRLLSGTSYDMGPSDMGNVFGALSAPTGSVSIFGTLGPPNFTLRTGARIGEGSIYCVSRDMASGSPRYTYDVLRLTPSPDGGVPGLQGTFSCYGGL